MGRTGTQRTEQSPKEPDPGTGEADGQVQVPLPSAPRLSGVSRDVEPLLVRPQPELGDQARGGSLRPGGGGEDRHPDRGLLRAVFQTEDPGVLKQERMDRENLHSCKGQDPLGREGVPWETPCSP